MTRLKFSDRDAKLATSAVRRRQQPLIFACFVMASLLASKSLMVVLQLDLNLNQSHAWTKSVFGLSATSTKSSFAITFSSQRRPFLSVVYKPKQLRRRSTSSNFNGLHFSSLTVDSFQRQVQRHDEQRYAEARSELLHDMRHGERSVYYHDEEQDRPRECERTNWRSSVYMNCNDFHIMDMREDEAYDKRFLGCVADDK